MPPLELGTMVHPWHSRSCAKVPTRLISRWSSEAHYFHHSCGLLYRYRGGEQQWRGVQSPNWYVNHLLDNRHVVRTGPSMAMQAHMQQGTA